MRSLGIVIVLAVVVMGCSEILAAFLVTVDIPADTYSAAEGRTWDIPVNISGCDSTDPDDCVTWHSDHGCVVRFGTGATATAVHFGTARVDVAANGGTSSDHADVTVLQQTPVKLELAERLLPLAHNGTGVLALKLFDASDHELRRPATFTSADTTVVVIQGVDPGCEGLWPDGVQIRGVGAGSTFVFARFDTLVDSSAVSVQP